MTPHALPRVCTPAVIAVAVVLPWRGTAWSSTTSRDLGPRAAASTIMAPTGMRGTTATASVAPRRYEGRSDDAPSPTSRAAGASAQATSHHSPALDEAIASLLAWVAADQARLSCDSTDGAPPSHPPHLVTGVTRR